MEGENNEPPKIKKAPEDSEEEPPEEPPPQEPPPEEPPPPPPPEEPPSPPLEVPPPTPPPQEPVGLSQIAEEPSAEAAAEQPPPEPAQSAAKVAKSQSGVTSRASKKGDEAGVESSPASAKRVSISGSGGNAAPPESVGAPNSAPCPVNLLAKRSPFIHNPPQPEERRPRIQCPRTPIEYLINLREDLADFQESHGLPRTRDYSFVSLGLALAQETGRAIYSVFLMFTELFPIIAIISLIMRFALDKLIEICETNEPSVKLKKAIIFGLEMLAIMIPLWILIGTIIIPLISLLFSIFKKILRIKGGKKKSCAKSKPKVKTDCAH